jgi:2-polyprenyl-6-methoxyphenol hydroxylase-like FAD-dependent oxidoreductase
MSTNCDVLVVGAGPVGLTMASELSRYGLSVRIIDQNTQRTDKSKALVLWPRTLELLDRKGSELARRFVASGLQVGTARILSGHEDIGHVDLTGVDSPYNFALMIPQADTERLLEEHLATLGPTVERQVRLNDFQTGPDRVSCRVVRQDQSEENIAASWLIGCDGAHSTVRHRLGMEFEGKTLPNDWALADVHLSGVRGEPAITVFWHKEGMLALFPMQGTRYRIVADIGPSSGPTGEGNRPAPNLEEVQQILDVRGPGGVRASDPVWLSAFTLNERKVANYRSDRVFLAGDAAHVHSPAGGQGMNTGMQDAFNLAWKLASVSRRISKPEPLLSSYSEERSPVAHLVLEATGKATSMAVLKGEFKQSIRNHVASLMFGFGHVTHAMANALSEMSVGYSKGPLTVQSAGAHGGPEAGKRAPIRKDQTPVGSGNTPLFALFAKETVALRSILARYPKLVEPSAREPYSEGGIWLVRPDGYVGLFTKHDAEVDQYLNRLANE